jgi:3-oxoacyl-[acyl-carrier protein] reductase
MTERSNQIALVTGAAVGIGRATALSLARGGADIAIHYHSSEPDAEALVVEVESLGRRALALPGDLTKSADVVRLVERTLSHFGRIDVLINNAGGLIARRGLADVTEDFYRAVMDVNVLTAILCARAVVPGMIARRHGAIVNVSSLAAHNGGGPGASLYAASKAALIALTKAWAKELAPHGIRVNAVAPGLVGGTPFHSTFTSPDAFQAAVKTIPLGRAGNPEDVAQVIAFLAGEQASFLAGETIEINGGMAMR